MNEELEIDEDEFREWLKMGITRRILRQLREIRDDQREVLASGVLDFDSVERTALRTARVTGIIEGLDVLLSLKHSEGQPEEISDELGASQFDGDS